MFLFCCSYIFNILCFIISQLLKSFVGCCSYILCYIISDLLSSLVGCCILFCALCFICSRSFRKLAMDFFENFRSETKSAHLLQYEEGMRTKDEEIARLNKYLTNLEMNSSLLQYVEDLRKKDEEVVCLKEYAANLKIQMKSALLQYKEHLRTKDEEIACLKGYGTKLEFSIDTKVKPNKKTSHEQISQAHIQRLTEVIQTAPMPSPPVRPFDPVMLQCAQGGNALKQPHPAISRRSQQGRRDKKPKIISLPTSQSIILHASENAWKPPHKAEKKTEEDLEEEDLFRKVRGILNKLTPHKFQTLVEQIKELPIDTMKKLEGTINLIFEKVLDEPNFSVPYANMCKQLALLKVPLDDGQGVVNFRKLLVTKCQKEFEQDKSSEQKREDKIKAMKAAKDDVKKYTELKLEIDEEVQKMRMRQLGNIRFIGELFKVNMLIEPIIYECIKKLLAQGDEKSLECVCCLLKTTGKELDERGSKCGWSKHMDSCFQNIQRLVEKSLTSSRLKFMLQDVIDLKKNNWIPRRDENNPKTIDQIHKEAEKEAREAQQVYQNIYFSKRFPDEGENYLAGESLKGKKKKHCLRKES